MAGFVQQSARPQATLAGTPYHRWETPGGDIVLMFYRVLGGYTLRFPDRADFTIAIDDRTVSCVPAPNVSQEVVSSLYFNQVIPLFDSSDGALVLHASAVSGDGVALAFLGPSGRGKSTLAAGFARHGHPFLTDDGLWLEQDGPGYFARPNRPNFRLWPDSENAILDNGATESTNDLGVKSHIASSAELPFHNGPLQLQNIYVLGEGRSKKAVFERLNSTSALTELFKYTFILDIYDRSRLKAHFIRLVQLAETIACFNLDYPRQYEALPEVIGAVILHAQSGAQHP